MVKKGCKELEDFTFRGVSQISQTNYGTERRDKPTNASWECIEYIMKIPKLKRLDIGVLHQQGKIEDEIAKYVQSPCKLERLVLDTHRSISSKFENALREKYKDTKIEFL